MLHANNPDIRRMLLAGNFGLEKESLRVTPDGFMATTPNPFVGYDHIVRDFSENQVEINTAIQPTPEAVIDELHHHNTIVHTTLAQANPPELLWPFSNPPYIRTERDIPIAQFEGALASKTVYREHLSDVYGRYKMAFSGIHFNYSFADELLQRDYEIACTEDGFTGSFADYKNDLYTVLAERSVAYGWLMVAITAASPLMDSSYVEKNCLGQDLYQGLSSTRCSELGYWNFFTPILDYSSHVAYADSIQRYIDEGLIAYPSELYYPVRLKPRGENDLDTLREQGVSHIELRMLDLNPLVDDGLDVRDVRFAQLLLIWLASTPRQPFTTRDQVQAMQNFKNAAHYDLKTVKIVVPNGEVYSVAHAALNVIGFMEDFFGDYSSEVTACLDFQKQKFIDPENRYSWQVRKQFSGGFVQKGLTLAEEQQKRFVENDDAR